MPLVCTVADSAGNVSLSVSAPVTSVNNMTGAVKISSVSTATSATTTPNVVVAWLGGGSSSSCSGGSMSKHKWTLPSGGTWRYITNTRSSDYDSGGTVSGGTVINLSQSDFSYSHVIAFRIA